MVQWINFLGISSFVNPMRLTLLCENTGTLAIVEPGLMAGRPTSRPLGRQKCCKVRNFKFYIFDF